jgi:hypothetical protein
MALVAEGDVAADTIEAGRISKGIEGVAVE